MCKSGLFYDEIYSIVEQKTEQVESIHQELIQTVAKDPVSELVGATVLTLKHTTVLD